MQLAEGSVCPTHPGARAIDTCARCGNYVCVQCMEVDKGTTLCTTCFQRFGPNAPHSGRATAAIICGVLAISGCVAFTGIPALILGHLELSAIQNGEAPAGGKNLAMGAVILGWISIALTVIGVLATWALFASLPNSF